MPVIRAVIFEHERLGSYRAEARGAGLDSWLGGGRRVEVVLEVLRITRPGLLVQEPPSRSVEPVWEPLLRIMHIGVMLCRFHEGPRGEPAKHRYCVNPAETRDGYCRLHRGSWKALYERCAQGIDSACIEAQRLNPGEKYSVYVLDYGGARAKVGLTQSWRLLWRIAEQPHVAAAMVYTGGLLDARETEKKLGRSRLGTEGAGARLGERLRLAVAEIERRLASSGEWARVAERLASLIAGLGLQGRFSAYTVLPREPGWLARARRLREPGELLGRRLRLVDYWAGLLALRDEETGELLALDRGLVQHRVLQGKVG